MRKIGTRMVVLMMAFGLLAGATGCYTKPQSGEIGVVRNGGPFDNHNIRQIVPNGASNTWNGFNSETHYYPVDTQQRFFRLQSCHDENGGLVPCNGADDVAITVPTSDGVEVGIEGTFYLNTGFNNSETGRNALKAFDTQFGTRAFGGEGLHAWDGNDGWKAFLGSIVEPVIANNLRETIAGITCAQLVSSCALVQNNGNTAQASQPVPDDKPQGNGVTAIQDRINAGLQADLNRTLTSSQENRDKERRNDYFTNIRFNLTKVDLPVKVQGAINDAQSAFAQVSQAQAKVRAAKLEAEANVERQKGYERCPTCAQIDQTKSIPKNITVWAPGNQSGSLFGRK